MQTKFLGDIPVSITPYNSLNFTKSVIKTPDLSDISEEDIIAGLYSQGVICCKRVSTIRDSRTIQTNTYILTFNRLQLPSVIDMGYLRVKRREIHPFSSEMCQMSKIWSSLFQMQKFYCHLL